MLRGGGGGGGEFGLTGPITQLGGPDAAAPVAQTLQVQNVIAGTNNTAGADFTIDGSRGTGSGPGGQIIFQTAVAGGGGSSQNSLTVAWQFTGNGDFRGGNTGKSISWGTTGLALNCSTGVNTLTFAQQSSPFQNAYITIVGTNAFQLGQADAASPSAQILQAQNVVAGTSNVGGANTTVIGSLSTGSGTSGDIIFQTGGTGAGATAQNAAATALTIKGATQNVRAATTISTPTVGSLSATTGAATLNVATSNFFTLTPTGNMTAITTTGTMVAGTYYYLVITTSGVSSFTLTFSTGFKVTGTLATGTSSGKVFVMQFISDGTNLNEVSRTTAM